MIVRDGNIVIERPQDPGAPGSKSLAGESRFKQLAKANLLSGKEIWAPMALSDVKLVIRDQSKMKCFNVATN